MNSLWEIASTGILLAIVAVSIQSLARLYASSRNGTSVVPFAKRRPVPWQFVHVSAAFAILMAGQVLGALILRPFENDLLRLLTIGFFTLISCLLTFIFLRVTTGAQCEDTGESLPSLREDIQSGLFVFGLVVIPTLSIQFALSQFVEQKHPIIQLLLDEMSPTLFAVAAVFAIAVAPVTEEFLFRVVLQGWLERVAHDAAIKRSRTDLSSFVSQVDIGSDGEHGWAVKPHWGPIIISSLIFSLAHLGNGLDPIPLFVFALGLGWLYQRTHRMWPGVLVHMLLNSFSMIQLAIFVASQR